MSAPPESGVGPHGHPWPVFCPECGGGVELGSGATFDCNPPVMPLRCIACGHEFRDFWDEPSPRFLHDCGRCVFLGPYTQGESSVDLYFCRGHESLGPTVTVRRGDARDDQALALHTSGLSFTDYMTAKRRGDDESLAEAMRRAVWRKLLTPGEMRALGVV